MVSTFIFDVEMLEKLRGDTSSYLEKFIVEKPPEGWSISPAKISLVFDICPELKLKRGWTLKAYQYFWNRDGNAIIWAMPKGLDLPKPPTSDIEDLEDDEELGEEEDVFYEDLEEENEDDDDDDLAKPPAALDDFMEALEGDGSPESYICASILARELREFGAFGHGISWGEHVLIGHDPWDGSSKGSFGDWTSDLPVDRWQWLEPKPIDWKPYVKFEDDKVAVSFYTYCGYDEEQILRHTDVYQKGCYSFDSKDDVVAVGVSGYLR